MPPNPANPAWQAFLRRRLPPVLPIPPYNWLTPYSEMARASELACTSLEQLHRRCPSFHQPSLRPGTPHLASCCLGSGIAYRQDNIPRSSVDANACHVPQSGPSPNLIRASSAHDALVAENSSRTPAINLWL